MPTDDQKRIIMTITVKLAQLGHEVTWQEPITTGPLITTYRFVPRNATKVAQIASCADDLAIALSVEDVLIRRLTGEAAIGVSVPNASRTMVNWRDTLASPGSAPTSPIPLNLGVDSQGRLYRDDLTLCPHLLIAGTTGGGKSTELNSIIASLMYWRKPDEVQFILSDTKNVEFGYFDGCPHVIARATSMYTTWEQMDFVIEEMERRLHLIAKAGKRNILEYNRHLITTIHPTAKLLPYIVLVIDELADVLGGDKRGEAKIAQNKLGTIVQKARAAGVHVIAATQRPSVNIVAGSIKANFPARLTFKLPSDADSRTVINSSGADHLLSQGDMLYLGPTTPGLRRLHAAYASQDDIQQMLRVMRLQYA